MLPTLNLGPHNSLVQAMDSHIVLSTTRPTSTCTTVEVPISHDQRLIIETVVTQTVRTQRKIGDIWLEVSAPGDL